MVLGQALNLITHIVRIHLTHGTENHFLSLIHKPEDTIHLPLAPTPQQSLSITNCG